MLKLGRVLATALTFDLPLSVKIDPLTKPLAVCLQVFRLLVGDHEHGGSSARGPWRAVHGPLAGLHRLVAAGTFFAIHVVLLGGVRRFHALRAGRGDGVHGRPAFQGRREGRKMAPAGAEMTRPSDGCRARAGAARAAETRSRASTTTLSEAAGHRRRKTTRNRNSETLDSQLDGNSLLWSYF